jgi:ABC-type transporter Mla subunit MlaD
MDTATRVQRTRKDPFHYRHRNLFVGLFLFIAMTIIPVLLVYTMVKKDFLEKWIYLSVRYDNVYGLQKGAAVNFLGVEIGSVDDISLSVDGYVDVSIKIRRRYFGLIEKGCIAGLSQKNFVVGDWQINLMKAEGVQALRPGDRIPSQPPIPLDHAIEQLTRMVSVMDTLFMQIRSGQGLLGSLVNDDTLMQVIKAYVRQIDGLFNDVDRTIARADRMINTLDRFGAHGTVTVDSFLVFSRSATTLFDKIDTLVGSVDSVANGLQRLPPNVDILIDGLKTDVKEAEVLLRGIQNHWFFKRAVKKTREEMGEK